MRSVILLDSEGFPTLRIEVLFSVVLLYELTENNFYMRGPNGKNYESNYVKMDNDKSLKGSYTSADVYQLRFYEHQESPT